MAKKKGARRAARYDDSDDEVSSTTSTTLSSDFGGQEADAVYDEDSAVEGYIDALYEKRATTREAGLRGLIGAFTTDVLSEFAESKFETLLQQYTISIRRGGAEDVRGAAGESIALLLEAGGADFLQQQQQHSSYSNGNGGGDDAEDEDEDEDYEWGGPQNGHRNGNGDDDEGVGASAADELVEAVRGLAVQPGRRQSKKERSQRGTFRDIMVSIEKGVCPEATIKLKQGDSLHISTWSQTVQLNAMRHLLAEGFQRHMQDNELMHQIFEYQPQVAKSRGFRSPAEKRMFQSPNSIAAKARTQNRKSRRSQAEAGNMGHFSIDEHDI
eukprot:jgi/Mesen1/4882/ME000244S04064